jgi:hypothetical protein
MKKVIAAAAVLAGLVLAPGALAAPNSGSISVAYNPPKLGTSNSTTIHVNVAQTSDAIAAVNIYTGTTLVNSGGAPGTTIGSVNATAIAHEQGGLTLPLSGSVVADDPAKHTTDACSPGTNGAVWNMNLSVAGQTLVIPIYVNKTVGATTSLGAYNLKICLTSWQVPSAQGGAPFGAQLTDAALTLNKIFTAPVSTGTSQWEALFTPYVTNSPTPNPGGTFEARAFVPLPVVLTIKVSYVKKTNTWKLTGKLTEGGKPVPRWTIRIARGPNGRAFPSQSLTKTNLAGVWKTAGHLKPKKTTYWVAKAAAQERDYTATGCQNPATAAAPAGCVKATLPPWSVSSVIVRIKR